MAWPPSALSWVAGAVSVLLAVVVAFAGNFVINLLAFWLVEIRGITLLWMITGGLLCGLYLPVPWFPDLLRTIATWSPSRRCCSSRSTSSRAVSSARHRSAVGDAGLLGRRAARPRAGRAARRPPSSGGAGWLTTPTSPSGCAPTGCCSPPAPTRRCSTAPPSSPTSSAPSASGSPSSPRSGSSSTTSTCSAASTSPAALLVFALSNLAFSLADMFVGHLDQLPRYIRAGRSTPSTCGRCRCSPSS